MIVVVTIARGSKAPGNASVGRHLQIQKLKRRPPREGKSAEPSRRDTRLPDDDVDSNWDKPEMDQRTRLNKAACRVVSFVTLLTLLGCGERLPSVSGHVTLDGEPLANATVLFMPLDENQSPAQGTTDKQGRYTLQQEEGTSGIQRGEYSVRISTFQSGFQDMDPPIPLVKETVPTRYNVETELKVMIGGELPPGENPFDFALKSGGRIFQPDSEPY